MIVSMVQIPSLFSGFPLFFRTLENFTPRRVFLV